MCVALAWLGCGAGGPSGSEATLPAAGDGALGEDRGMVVAPAAGDAQAVAAVAGGRGIFAVARDPWWVAHGGPVLVVLLADPEDLCRRLGSGGRPRGAYAALWARQVGGDGVASMPGAGRYTIDAARDPFVAPEGDEDRPTASRPLARSPGWPRRPAGTPFWWPRAPSSPSAGGLALAPGRHAGALLLAGAEDTRRGCRPCELAAATAGAAEWPSLPRGELMLELGPEEVERLGGCLKGQLEVKLGRERGAEVATRLTLAACPALAQEAWAPRW